MECNNLFQVITEPIRITEHSATVLDLIIISEISLWCKIPTLMDL